MRPVAVTYRTLSRSSEVLHAGDVQGPDETLKLV